jgi:phosphoglycolate phosphatase
MLNHLKKRLQNKTHVIWDWNGTLVDDVDLCIEIIGEIALRHGLKPIQKEEYLRKFRFPVADYYKDIGFTDLVLSPQELTKQFISQYGQKVHSLKLYHGMGEFLVELRELGIRQSILSAAHEFDLRRLLTHFQISHLFTFIYGLNNHDAHSKIERGRDLIQKINEPLSKIVLIGDTLHDKEVAEDLGIDVILLSDGHQHPELLSPLTHLFMDRTRP